MFTPLPPSPLPLMRARLTERQNQVYEYVRAHVREYGKPPTLQEIGRALAIRSTNGVHKLLVALEQKGYVRRTPNEARGLALIGEAGEAFGADDGAPFLPIVTRASSRAPEHLRTRRGRTLVVDPQLFSPTDPDRCLLVVAGDDGMNGDGIRKGDFLVVEEAAWPELRNGQTVAVLFEERLVARRFDAANGQLHFRPADRTYAEEMHAPDDPACYVIGGVRAVLRRL